MMTEAVRTMTEAGTTMMEAVIMMTESSSYDDGSGSL